MNFQHIKQLIANNELQTTMKQLKPQLAGTKYANQLIMLESQLSSLSSDKISDILNSSDATIRKNQITAALLNFVDSIEKGTDSSSTNSSPQNTGRNIQMGDKSIYIEKNDGPINIS